jgi:hypothetical protein
MQAPVSAGTRCTPPPTPPFPSNEYLFQPDEYVTLILTSEIAEGAFLFSESDFCLLAALAPRFVCLSPSPP